MLQSFRYREYRSITCVSSNMSRQILGAVIDGEFELGTVFRDNRRTLSAQVTCADQSLLLKVPRARNGRKWERFLTLFRESDAFRTLHNLELMRSMGFSAPEPVLAGERRAGGVVVDSFVCYRFVEGRRAEPRDASAILAAIEALHQRGYLRGDAQLANFLIVEGNVTFIDFRLKRPRWLPKLQKAREIDRFLRSCPEARKLLTPDQAASSWLKLASILERFSFGLRTVKRNMRKCWKSDR
ncbi:MAG: hypothetical protein GYB26_07905 [Gammaproteobacteria bacterium]|uniref:lipopolysaccharide core heptose(II) kinase RfaY n=1 Tax=Marinobacter sp. TaxID=50741 RepID=UPI003A8DA1F9|nr:hypothetical protein [Gammaproteobacteria bacterium]